MNRVVGWRALKDLLQPTHRWFQGKGAYMVDFAVYRAKEGGKTLIYPRVAGPWGGRLPRENPYRKYQLSRSHTGRKIKAVVALVESFKLNDFRVASVVLTFPEEISRWLSRQENGREMAWRLFGKFWAWYDRKFGPGLAANVNLHTWKTEKPVDPHFHFHLLAANYREVEVPSVEDEDGNSARGFEKQPWHRQRGKTLVPWSDEARVEVKSFWWETLDRFASRHGVTMPLTWCPENIDIYVDFISLDDELGKAKLMHKFNYQGRHPMEDYARYSNKDPDCADPPGWLQGYDNRARPFGWWRRIGALAKDKSDREKLHPVSGEKLEYVGPWPLEYVLKLGAGRLGFLDMVRGKPVFAELRSEEIAWLRSVVRSPPWLKGGES